MQKNGHTSARAAVSTRVVVGMATCGIAAGARPVLNTFVEEVANAGLTDKVTVTQTGCIGICQYEPVVEVFEAGKDKVDLCQDGPPKRRKRSSRSISRAARPVEEYIDRQQMSYKSRRYNKK